jgi:hypothetical protein
MIRNPAQPVFALAGAAALALTACGPATSDAPTDAARPESSPAALPQQTDSPAGGPPATVAPAAVPSLVPEAEKGEKGARNVLLAWAHALELGDHAAAYALYGEGGARSGMTPAEFSAYWRRFKTVTIAVPGGTMEGAAGSSYYTAPATVVGKLQNGSPYRLEGEVVLRRVNDVPGATAEQLRWHLESSRLAPVS